MHCQLCNIFSENNDFQPNLGEKKIVHRLYELRISTELPNLLQGNPDSFEVSRKILIAVSNTCISLPFC